VRRRRANEYYLASRVFERMELRILADMVRASRVLTKERSEELIEKLGTLASRGDTAFLFQPYGCGNPHKTENERAFLNAGRILCALEKGSRLSFVCCQFTASKTLAPRRGGEATIVNPYLLVYAEDHYYLIADHPAREGFAHYRLDQMADVRVLDEPAVPPDPAFDAAAYARSVFSMAPAEQRWVRLLFDRRLIGCMVDRFGTDVPIEQLCEETCALRAPVRVSPPFYGRVFQFGGGVRILEPDDVRERMLLMLEAARKTEKNR
jgi:predicted DNA-binding transcriptional regulator YafY